MANTYDVGDVVRIQAAFDNAASVPVDPGVVTFKIKTPAGTTTTYVYGTDAAVVKTGTGRYYVDYVATMEGRHEVRYAGTVSNIAAGESHFFVAESMFN